MNASISVKVKRGSASAAGLVFFACKAGNNAGEKTRDLLPCMLHMYEREDALHGWSKCKGFSGAKICPKAYVVIRHVEGEDDRRPHWRKTAR